MRKHLAVTVLLCLLASPAFSQTSTATGVGVANSSSQSGSVAIGGGNATGGKATGGKSISALTVNSSTPAQTSASVSTNLTGTSSVKNVPAVFAPGLAAAGLETCLGSVSGGGSALGWGATFGTTVPDPGCQARLDSRTMWAMGLKAAAIARLCIMPDNYRAMPDICNRYMPRERAAYAQASVTPEYAGGPIMLVEGKTGKDRLCEKYDTAHRRCRVWAVIP